MGKKRFLQFSQWSTGPPDLSAVTSKIFKYKTEKIYLKYGEMMYNIAFTLLQHEQDAQDAVQQAFVSIAENIADIDGLERKTKGYVSVIVENKAIDLLRKREQQPLPLNEEDSIGIEIEYEGDNFLASCINTLPALQRQVVWLKCAYGYSLQEIADKLKMTYGSVCKIYQRAKAKLKELCTKEGYQFHDR